MVERLLGKKTLRTSEERVVGEFMGRQVIDMRPDEERQIEQDALAGASLGEQVDALVEELKEIAVRDSFLSGKAGGKYNDQCRHIRAEEMGVTLNEKGGKKLMQAGWYRIRHELGAATARELEYVWSGVGQRFG